MSRDDIREKIARAAAGGEVSLDLGGAGLGEVPREVWGLTNLKSLNLGGNALKRLPAEIGNLKGLADLDLSGNRLAALPAEIGGLARLTLLDVSDNLLAGLPEEFGGLQELMALWLGGNRLAEVPRAVAGLSRLRLLGLERNRLTELPAEMRRLKKLAVLKLEGNPLPIPPEILLRDEEPERVVGFYFAQRECEKRPLNEAKLLVVGHANAGKTSLVNALLGREFNPREGATEGIDIVRWRVAAGGRGDVRLNVWDFGGQEIMHATHQFFLKLRSLYVLVVDAREGQEDSRVEYWLKIIQSFGKDSPVVVVGNKIDQDKFEVNRGRLQTKYPNIRAFVETSCQTGRGVEELKSVVAREVSALEHVCDTLPAAWLAVKARLEAAASPRVAHGDFARLCREEQVADEPSQATLVSFLHDLGVVLCFRDDARRDGPADLFNPKWVTNGVYKILRSAALAESGGLLERGALAGVLDPREYPAETHAPLLDMMRKFELGYDCGEARGERFLVPGLLGREVPATGDWSGALVFHYHYGVLPASVISRFIVRTHRSVWRDTLWRTGVVLKGEEGNRALVEADLEDRKVVVLVDGPEGSRRRFLDLVRSHFEAVHRTLPGIIAVEDAPPSSAPAAAVDYKRLLLEIKLVTEQVPERLESVVNLKWLLDGIETERARKARLASAAHGHRPPAAPAAPVVSPSTPDAPARNAAAVTPPTPQAVDEMREPDTEALAQLARIKQSLDAASRRFARWCLIAYLAFLVAVAAVLVALIFRLGWNTMEPWTFLIGGVAALGTYAYFALTLRESTPQAIYEHLVQWKRRKTYAAAGFDPEQFERLAKPRGE